MRDDFGITKRLAARCDRSADLVPVEAGLARRELLVAWGRRNGRNFPWRRERDPWRVLLTEMLLRRTRAEQVAAHWDRLVERFPNPHAVVQCDIELVEEVLRPLGLTWRARTVRDAAIAIVDRHGGRVPLNLPGLLELPGVGEYVASATLAATSRTREILIDTNTVRVGCRVAGIDVVGDIRRRRDVRDAVRDLLGGPASARQWWTVLDLANKVCRPTTPLCWSCPINKRCATATLRPPPTGPEERRPGNPDDRPRAES